MIIILRFFTGSTSFASHNDPVELVLLLNSHKMRKTQVLGANVAGYWLEGDDPAMKLGVMLGHGFSSMTHPACGLEGVRYTLKGMCYTLEGV